jgi:hypothetical protein
MSKDSAPQDSKPTSKMPIYTLIGGVGAAIVGVVCLFLLQQWNAPDVRYEEGAYYRPGDEAITSLKLHNFGHGDANDIVITATFPKPLAKQPASDSDAYPFEPTSLAQGQESVTGRLKRLAPDQTLYIYFTVKSLGRDIANHKFVTDISYAGGLGTTGEPTLFKTLRIVLFALFGFTVPFLLLDRLFGAILRRRWDRYGKEYKEMEYKVDRSSKDLISEYKEMNAELLGALNATLTKLEAAKQETANLSTQLESARQEKAELAKRLEAQAEKKRAKKLTVDLAVCTGWWKV